MLEVLFLTSLTILAYIYIGYPLLVYILSLLWKQKAGKGDSRPFVSVLISAYNEEEFIEQTINNKLEQDYPSEKLEVIVVSDGSTDDTDRIVRDISSKNSRVKFFRQEPRQGKTSALNMAVVKAAGEIIVFSDANSIYESDAVARLVSSFSDPSVGYVTGKMIYTAQDGSLIGDGCSAYMRYENFIREHESGFNSVVGVDGGIDAVRKSLYRPMNPDQLPDFVLPLMVAGDGYRVIYEPGAVLREPSLEDYGKEYRMRVRVSLRALWALFDMRTLLNPLRYPLFSWQLVSHKLLRYLAWLPLAILFVLNPFLLAHGIFYQFMFWAQILAYGLSITGYFWNSQRPCPRYVVFCYYFVLINIAAAMAFLQFLGGKKQVIWAPRTG